MCSHRSVVEVQYLPWSGHNLYALIHCIISDNQEVTWLCLSSSGVYKHLQSCLWEPLTYPLLFPHGTLGWGIVKQEQQLHQYVSRSHNHTNVVLLCMASLQTTISNFWSTRQWIHHWNVYQKHRITLMLYSDESKMSLRTGCHIDESWKHGRKRKCLLTCIILGFALLGKWTSQRLSCYSCCTW